ncbi:MAG: hypothetical protein ACEPOV_14560 [Hyphomicrobiales bacterium]
MKHLFFLLLFFTSSLPQNTYFKLVSSFPSDNTTYITSDNKGSLYAYQQDTLWKYDPDGDPIANFNDRLNYNLFSIDASNPYHVMLFYPDQSQIDFINEYFKQENLSIDLDEIGMSRATVACSSYENGFWLYNPVTSKLYRYNNQTNLVLSTKSLNEIISNDIEPNYMVEVNNTLYVNDPNIGIMIFTVDGEYVKTLQLNGIDKFQVIDGMICYQSGLNLNIYNIYRGSNNVYSLPMEDVDELAVSFAPDTWRLFIANKEGVYIYSVNMNLFK